MLLIHGFLCIVAILEEICDKSSKTARSENILFIMFLTALLAVD